MTRSKRLPTNLTKSISTSTIHIITTLIFLYRIFTFCTIGIFIFIGQLYKIVVLTITFMKPKMTILAMNSLTVCAF